jgi:sugar-specific transcriptional regulator TrmB
METSTKSTYAPYLTALGLSENEAAVYEALLTRGSQTASKLSLATSIPRTLLYNVLEKLEALALVTRDDSAKVALFTAAAPETLTTLAEKKKRESEEALLALTNISPQLRNLHALATGKPGIQFFEGHEGAIKLLDDTLTAQSTVYTYTDLEMLDKYIPEINRDHAKKRDALGLKKKILFPDNQENRFLLEGYHTKVTEAKLIPSPSLTTAMQIYDGRVSYLTFSDTHIIGVIITDPAIYAMHKALFKMLYDSPLAKPL